MAYYIVSEIADYLRRIRRAIIHPAKVIVISHRVLSPIVRGLRAREEPTMAAPGMLAQYRAEYDERLQARKPIANHRTRRQP